jgi:hypothetical protein
MALRHHRSQFVLLPGDMVCRDERLNAQSTRMPSMLELGGFCKILIRNICSRDISREVLQS